MSSSNLEDSIITDEYIEYFKFFIKDIYKLSNMPSDDVYKYTLWMDKMSNNDWKVCIMATMEVYGSTLADLVNSIRYFNEHKEEFKDVANSERILKEPTEK